ncbi:hypothetical protein [Thiohalorhabdus sp.]|uniref:hypothetical protein n=1 Tax=Thiohalorhabdus sp. TaxID=3094134 RepID=UPI002FC2E926
MAETPSSPIPGSRPVETSPIRVGQSRPGTPTLQPDRLYPARVVRGGEQPILRMLGHNVQGEPQRPGLTEGNRLLVRPEIQGSRVYLHVMNRGDILDRVSQRFGGMLQRHPWPLPSAPQPGSGGLSASQGQGAERGSPGGDRGPGRMPLVIRGIGSGAASRGGEADSGPLRPGARSPSLPATARLIGGAENAPVRLVRVADPGQWAQPRVPFQAAASLGQGALQAAASGSASGGTQSAVSAGSQGGSAAAPGGEGRAPMPPSPAGAEGRGAPRSPEATQRTVQGLVSAFLNTQGDGGQRIAGSRDAARHWLEALLKPARETAGGERADRSGSLTERLLTEKGRLLLDRWAFIPLPLSGERSGAWIHVPERHHPEGGEEAGPEQAQTLRVWLTSERLGGMELILPLGEGRIWRVRCESAATMAALEEQQPRLERLCRKAGQAITLRIEGPDPGLGNPPESLRRAQALERTVSARA